MNTIEGKHFSITDPEGVKTVIYQVNKTEKEFLKDYPKYTVERLEHTEELLGNNLNKKTFYVDEPQKNGNQLVILSFGKDKVVINTGILLNDEVKITKRPTPFKFNTLYSEDTEYKEFEYTPNLKRPISIIDPETTEEIKPRIFFDEKTNEVKGKCKLKPNKSYFAFEIRDDKK